LSGASILERSSYRPSGYL